ncbi:hypothetical protein [Sphingomonas sp. BK580]|uniref:hypothetical protein n=1 Tax=Sphingomonas sp. BK580 TaxID=2586972 RepID=UPI001610592B|nr:hypothetical protein [Sphingomonas sp. BK580]MBB3693557.1 hypothetical protein [Sphingomonas sp. BK580]
MARRTATDERAAIPRIMLDAPARIAFVRFADENVILADAEADNAVIARSLLAASTNLSDLPARLQADDHLTASIYVEAAAMNLRIAATSILINRSVDPSEEEQDEIDPALLDWLR